jgi:L,D-transpeptidase YcbB
MKHLCRIGYSFPVFSIAAVILLSYGCGQWVNNPELTAKTHGNQIISESNGSDTDTEICYEDKISLLFKKCEKHFSKAWRSSENLEQMFYVIRNAYKEGLNPEDYNLSSLENLSDKIILSDTVNAGDVARLESLMNDAFLLLSVHLVAGRTDAEIIDPQWNASRRVLSIDWEKFIDSTLQNKSIVKSIQSLTPSQRGYTNLKKALAQYRKIEETGGWGKFTTSLPKLEKGMCNTDIALLKDRLAISQEYYTGNQEDRDLFDEALQEQVVLFQQRNGLNPDGVVGKGTIEALNITVEERIASIEANLERWRWLSDQLGRRYITVNIANFELQVIQNDSIIFSDRVIVGSKPRKTPVFSSLMTYMVLNPDWTVPPTIQKDDIIPSMIDNPDYLAKKNLKILRTDGSEVDPLTIKWDKIDSSGFPYRIHQEPGPHNVLGRVKFVFPNKYSIYIHDTPNQSLFSRTDRSFSSGCIRVSRPLDLAACLLKDNPGWSKEQIKSVIDKGKARTIALPQPIEVHIVYLTAWAADDGVVSFRKDVYELDQPLLTAFRASTAEGD